MRFRRGRRLLDYFLLGVALAALLLAVAAMFGGTISTSVSGIRISSHTVLRPVVVAVSALLIAVHLSTHRAQQARTLWRVTQQHANVVAAGLAIFVFAVAMRMSSFEAIAADQYGYVSQAELWAGGSLVAHEPLATGAPWPDAIYALAPLGYRPGLEPATIVPVYPPGLPLVMAAFLKIFGRFGPFLVVPVFGAVAVAAAFVLGRRYGGPACALMSAIFLITSPVFLHQVKEAMSDVPVTAWWLVAIILVTSSGAMPALLGGLAASAAILTRPNLVPLAVVLALCILGRSTATSRSRFRDASMFALGVIPGCAGVALFNQSLYGSPLLSGYGATSSLFSRDYFMTNASRYSRWLLETETPFVLLAVGVFWVLRTNRDDSRQMSWAFLGFSAAVYALYAFYLPWDNWTFLRFLLPAIPLLLLMSSRVVIAVSDGLRSQSGRFAVTAMLTVLLAWRWDTAGLRPPRPNDCRFRVIGEFVRDHLPQNAIVVAMIHSGSVRYYSGRKTVRWDWIPVEHLESSVAYFTDRGYRPYLLIEEWERKQFTGRFGPYTKLGTLDWPASASYGGPVRADIYELVDRNRVVVGDPTITRTIGTVAADPR